MTDGCDLAVRARRGYADLVEPVEHRAVEPMSGRPVWDELSGPGASTLADRFT